MIKYRLVKERLLQSGLVKPENFRLPPMVSNNILSLTHSADYIEKLETGTLSPAEIRKIGFPYSKAMVDREKYICGAMIEASLEALRSGVSFNMAGGTHHAFKEYGSAFCIFNDMAVAANYLLHENIVRRILIVDLDAHQGNGTSAIFAQYDTVFVFNVFSKQAFPYKKERSHFDLVMDENTNDFSYLEKVELPLTSIINKFEPDLVMFQSGVDLLYNDKLGRMKLTEEGIRQRDRLVFELCRKNSIPVSVCMGGGYSPEIEKIVTCHFNTIKEAISTIKCETVSDDHGI